MRFRLSHRALRQVLLAGACVLAAVGCGDNNGPNSASGSDAVELVGCTTVRYRGQTYQVNICSQTGNPVAFTTIANGTCSLTVLCQGACISSIPSGKCGS